jgi:hypothetical protein
MPEPAINRRVGGLLMAVAAVLSACETRVVSHNSFLTGLQGSEQQLPRSFARTRS